MDKVLKIYELVNNVETPFPNSTLQAELYSFQHDCKRMGNAPTITGTIMYPLCLDEEWSNNVFIGFKGERYYIDSIPSSSYSNEDVRYKHDLTFVSERKVLEDEYFCEIVEVNGEKSAVKTEFSFFGDIYMLVDKLNDYLQWAGMDYRITIDSGITTEEKEIVISNMKINDVLKYGFELFDIPYYFVGKVCTYGLFENEIEDVFEYGVNNSLLSIRKENRNEPIVTKITGVGSSDNIPYFYPNPNPSGKHSYYTEPYDFGDNIQHINFLKLDQYISLRNGGEVTFYKATIDPIKNDRDSIKMDVDGTIVNDYKYEWDEDLKNIADGTYHISKDLEIKLFIKCERGARVHIDTDLTVYNDYTNTRITPSSDSDISVFAYNLNFEWQNFNVESVPFYINTGRGSIEFVVNPEMPIFTHIVVSFKYNYFQETGSSGNYFVPTHFFYNSEYHTDQRKLYFYPDRNNLSTKTYEDIAEVITPYNEGIRTFVNTCRTILSRELSAHSNGYFNTTVKAIFLDERLKEIGDWFVINASSDVVISSPQLDNFNAWIEPDTKYAHFRNSTGSKRIYTATWYNNIKISTPDNITAYGIKFRYESFFKRSQYDYDYFKLSNNKRIKYNASGIKFINKHIAKDGDKIVFSPTYDWIEPQPNLMPSVYRKSYGKDIWYKALNDTHKDANGNYITFENLFNSQRPKTLIADPKNDIKPTIVGIVNSGATNIYWNQLIKPINSDNYTIKYATIKEADGSIIISATSVVNVATFIPNDTFLIKGHKYYIEINTSYKGVEKIITHRLSLGGFILATTNRNFIYICKNNQEGIILHCYSDSETDVLLNKFIITDLTLMFGEGNEPTNIQEFYDRLPSTINLNSFNILLDNYSEPILVGSENNTGKRIDQFLDIAFDNNDNNVDWKPLEGSSESSDNSTRGTEELIHSFFFAKLKKTDGDMGFNLFDQSNGEMTITMTSGLCGSCDFKIMVNDDGQNTVQVDENGDLVRDEDGNVKFGTPQDIQQDTSKAEVWIALLKEQDSYGVIMPDKQNNIIPTTDDTFVITNILMPEQYFINAENKLEQELLKEMSDKNTDKFNFSIDFSRIFLAENPSVLQHLNENSKIYVKYNQRILPLYISSYLFKCNKNESLPDVKVELIDKLNLKTNDIQKEINKIKKQIISAK